MEKKPKNIIRHKLLNVNFVFIKILTWFSLTSCFLCPAQVWKVIRDSKWDKVDNGLKSLGSTIVWFSGLGSGRLTSEVVITDLDL